MIRAARLPDDEPAILSFIWGLQKFENAFEPNRRLDPAFAAEHWADVQVQAAARGAIFIAENDGRAVGWAFVLEEPGDLFVAEKERRHGFVAELFVEPQARGRGNGRALIAACEDWTRADLDGTNPMCRVCGEPHVCGNCGYEIDNDGHCLRERYDADDCPRSTP